MKSKTNIKKPPLVLLIDDDPNDQELARIALENSKIPHELSVIGDGAEALAWIENMDSGSSAKEPMPQLILLDLKLPKVTGHEILKRLRSRKSTSILPVVVFTSSGEDRDRVKSYKLKANAYVRKPENFKEYKVTVADMGRFWIARNQLPASLNWKMKVP